MSPAQAAARVGQQDPRVGGLAFLDTCRCLARRLRQARIARLGLK
jgi:hypothetical protein